MWSPKHANTREADTGCDECSAIDGFEKYFAVKLPPVSEPAAAAGAAVTGTPTLDSEIQIW